VLNVTAVSTGGPAGYVTVFPGGTPPNASSLNVASGATVANEVIAKVSATGTVSLYTQSPAHLIADVVGWFPTGGDYTSLAPGRLLDTRTGATTIDGIAAGTGLPAAGSTTELQVTGRGGVPGSGVAAVVLNVTAVSAGGPAGYVTVFPGGTPPNASSLNVASGATVANEVIAKVSATGTVSLYTQSPAHLIADVVGWFPSGDDTGSTTTTSSTSSSTTSSTVVTGTEGKGTIQVIYAYASDVAPVAGREAALRHTVEEVIDWYDGETGGEHPRFIRDGADISVISVQINHTADELKNANSPEFLMHSSIQAALPPDRIAAALAIAYEGEATQSCGRTGSSTMLIPMAVCGLYPSATLPFPQAMAYVMAHEAAHLLGAVPVCAPNEDGSGHIFGGDNRDLMYIGPGTPDYQTYVLDAGHDDYYLANIPGCPGIEASQYLGSD